LLLFQAGADFNGFYQKILLSGLSGFWKLDFFIIVN
jgi:hypothetical protein